MIHNLSPGEFMKSIKGKDVFLIKAPTTYPNVLEGTKLVMTATPEEYLDLLPKNKSVPLHVYCRRGISSSATARTLQDLGYKDIYNLEGGLFALAEYEKN